MVDGTCNERAPGPRWRGWFSWGIAPVTATCAGGRPRPCTGPAPCAPTGVAAGRRASLCEQAALTSSSRTGCWRPVRTGWIEGW